MGAKKAVSKKKPKTIIGRDPQVQDILYEKMDIEQYED